LDSYKNPNSYRAAEKSELASAVAAGIAAIDAATSISGVETALANAKSDIDDIKTDAQLTEEENGKNKITVAIAVEKLTVDGSYISEPILLTVPESTTAAQALIWFLDDSGIEYRYRGKINSSGFYLEGVSDINEPDGFIDEFDHGELSGWMYCVNNAFPNVSAGATVLNDGDVMRWQYTCVGLGSDIKKQGNKDGLLKKIAEINADGKQSNPAYDGAMAVLKDLDATQSQIDEALDALKTGSQTAITVINDNSGEIEITAEFIGDGNSLKLKDCEICSGDCQGHRADDGELFLVIGEITVYNPKNSDITIEVFFSDILDFLKNRYNMT
jgi:hypothetical protein